MPNTGNKGDAANWLEAETGAIRLPQVDKALCQLLRAGKKAEAVKRVAEFTGWVAGLKIMWMRWRCGTRSFDIWHSDQGLATQNRKLKSAPRMMGTRIRLF